MVNDVLTDQNKSICIWKWK